MSWHLASAVPPTAYRAVWWMSALCGPLWGAASSAGSQAADVGGCQRVFLFVLHPAGRQPPELSRHRPGEVDLKMCGTLRQYSL